MTAASKKKFGRYKILSAIGAGAMGEVFLAEDPKLKRILQARVNFDRTKNFLPGQSSLCFLKELQ